MFFIGMLIFVIASIAVTYKILTGYASISILSKACVLLFLIISWFTPVWLHFLKKGPDFLSGPCYDVAYKLGYFMMGFVLILTMLLIFRDVVWHILHLLLRSEKLNPDSAYHINLFNMLTLGLSFLISLYGVYEAHKTPEVKNIYAADERIKEPVKFVVASDFHINRSTPKFHIHKIIDAINAQNPDYILLVGDVVDDDPEYTLEKFKMLTALKAKKIYITLGNHEFYNKPYAWMIEFAKEGFEILHNTGEKLEKEGIYVAGVPDVGTTDVNYDKAFLYADDDEYKILLSHSPADFNEVDKTRFDIQFSGHTHGGQIFPFQYITKKANAGYLEGLYKTENADLFVMHGAGYWGPPMRIGAAPDIAVLTLEPKK